MITRRSNRVEVTNHALSWTWDDCPGAGFSFPCDSSGTVNESCLIPAALDNLRKCRSGEYAVSGPVLKSWVQRYTEPAEGRCSCGSLVTLEGFTNTCERCGADYNMSGQRLANRSQWGEETGESLGDILAIR